MRRTPKLIKNPMKIPLKPWKQLMGNVGEQNMVELISEEDSDTLAALVWEAKPGNEHGGVNDFEEVVIVLEGEHTCIDLYTGKEYHLKPGDVLFQGIGTKVKWITEKGAKGISVMSPRSVANKML